MGGGGRWIRNHLPVCCGEMKDLSLMFSNPSKCDGYKPDDITYELRLRCERTTTDTQRKRVYVHHRSPCHLLTGNRKQVCQFAPLRCCSKRQATWKIPSSSLLFIYLFIFNCIFFQNIFFSNFAEGFTVVQWVALTKKVVGLIPEQCGDAIRDSSFYPHPKT